ncbi:MAG: class I SAM-dependent methyltransferase [Dehalococcoidales bacterium]|nr:class I SAM-dependent methyltransferase [Dehalococcoidales bacterium]
MERYTAYDDFAWLYNREWIAYGERIFPVLKDIAGETLPDRGKILDLCCGTGQLAKVLTEKGYKVTGIDGSANQIKYARKNAPGARFIIADARDFKLPPEYDAVLSTFDSLNHILKPIELRKVFRNVSKCLASGGVFIFDMNTEKTFEKGWKVSKEIKETPEYFFAHYGDYNKESKIAEFHCTIFQPKAKNWKRTDINIQERYYTQTEVIRLLKRAGFTSLKKYAADRERGLHKPNRGSYKIFYYARKP